MSRHYPRPPRLESTAKELRVVFNGQVIAESRRAYRVLETSHPPTYYLPPADVAMRFVEARDKRSFCEFKGTARYYDVTVDDRRATAAAWSYPEPTEPFAAIRDHLAFYAHAMDACYVDGERVQAQEGDFYGGWITSEIVGPFKGAAGTWGW